MRQSMKLLLPALLLAAWLPAQAQSQEPARAGGSIAGKANAKTAPATPAAKAAAERRRLQATATAAAIPATAAAAQSTSPAANPVVPAGAKDKSHCHSSGSDA